MTTNASSPALVGRNAELTRLHELLDQAEQGAPRTLVLAGEAGIGKTRLLGEFEREVADDVLVLRGQCVDLGAVAAPYAPIKAALRSLVAAFGAERILEIVGPGAAALIGLLPELARERPDGDESPSRTAAAAAGSGQLHEAVAVLLETASRERPVLFVIEDLHWIDGASLGMLRFLMRVVTTGSILFVLTVRTEDVARGHPVRAFLSEADRSRSVERRELVRFSRSQVRKQVRLITGENPPDALVDSVFDRSDGIPFFVEELLGVEGSRSSVELPDTLRELLLARYDRLGDPAQSLLRLLSTGGVCVAHTLTVEVFDGTAEELDAAVREAVTGGVLLVAGDDYAFRHALVREAIQAEVLPGERARFHARYAQAYESAAGARRVAAEVSYHWLGAHELSRAFPATIDAMWEARASSAYATAAQMGERAIELWERVPDAEAVAGMTRIELIGRTASHLRHAGEPERALAMIQLGTRECPRSDPQYPRLIRDKALYLGNLGKPGSIELLEEALELTPPGERDAFRSGVLTALAGRLMIEGRLRRSVEVATQARDLAVSAGDRRNASVASNILGSALAELGDIEGGKHELVVALDYADDDLGALLRYWVNASDLAYLLGEHAEAVRLAEAGLARSRESGMERASGLILASNAVDPLFALGEWARADALVERALALDPPPAFRVYLLRARIWGMLWRGDPEGARREWQAVRQSMQHLVDIELQTRLGVGRVSAEIALEAGDIEAAWREVGVLIDDRFEPLPGYALPFLWVASRVISAARAHPGSVPAAEAAEPAFRALLGRLHRWPTHVLWAAFFDAELANDPALWEKALAAAHEESAPGFAAPYALLELGRSQLAAGERAAARESLHRAIESAHAAGVALVADEAARLASSAGVAVGGTVAAVTRVPAQSVELTAREQQVLDLIAEGLSNRQIGERLFISGKTASVHVSAILRKLGASSRTEAVFRASAH